MTDGMMVVVRVFETAEKTGSRKASRKAAWKVEQMVASSESGTVDT